MKLKSILLTLSLSMGHILFAQKGNIEGLIADAESNTPLNGASVNMGVGAGNNTDLCGRFRSGEPRCSA